MIDTLFLFFYSTLLVHCVVVLKQFKTLFHRCAKYTGLPSTCTLISDPQDPICCKVPKCTYTQGSGTTGFATAPPGVISGGIVTPTPQPALPTPPGYTGPPLMPTQAPQYKGLYMIKG